MPEQRRNENGECMVEHHICYEEIDGWDETEWMTAGAHHSLHHHIRQEGIYNIPVGRMEEISRAARGRTKQMKKYHKQWQKDNPEKLAMNMKRWREKNPEKIKRYGRDYRARKKEEMKRNAKL